MPSSPALPATDLPLPLLGGLTPERFMRRHWQKKPLLVRQALPEPQRYTHAKGQLELRQGLAQYYSDQHGVEVDPERLMATVSDATFEVQREQEAMSRRLRSAARTLHVTRTDAADAPVEA